MAATRFLNVDLDIRSGYDLQPLVAALGRKVIVLHAGREGRSWCAHLELSRAAVSADSAIRQFCALIRSLPPEARRLWDTAKRRDFNIGVEAGHEPHSSEFAVDSATVAAVAALAVRIVFTVYAPLTAARAAPTPPIASSRLPRRGGWAPTRRTAPGARPRP